MVENEVSLHGIPRVATAAKYRNAILSHGTLRLSNRPLLLPTLLEYPLAHATKDDPSKVSRVLGACLL